MFVSTLAHDMRSVEHHFAAICYVLCSTAAISQAIRHEKQDLDGVAEGNGYESEGINGHHGLFHSLDWTKAELRSISVWHATAQYQNVIELVKEKLSSSSVHPAARQAIEAFIAKHRPPQSVQSLLTAKDRKQ
ncbi:Protein C45E1.4, partial [Aphelenchoides avenae]